MEPHLFFSRHARDRMLDRGLDVEDVRAALRSSETIEEHDDASRLVLGRSGLRALHVVVKDVEPVGVFVVTVYEPDPGRWDASLRRRIGP
ncbi:MAG: DUF4258 domain-containing protein [Acidimicrobiales bacterium]